MAQKGYRLNMGVSPLPARGKEYPRPFAGGCPGAFMDTVVGLLEKAAVLVVLMLVLGRTGFLTRLTTQAARHDALLAYVLFNLMALTESWLALPAFPVPPWKSSNSALVSGSTRNNMWSRTCWTIRSGWVR